MGPASIHKESFYLSKLGIVKNSQLSIIPLPWILLSECNFTTLEIFSVLSLISSKQREFEYHHNMAFNDASTITNPKGLSFLSLIQPLWSFVVKSSNKNKCCAQNA